MDDFNDRFKAMRKALNKSQLDFSKEFNITQPVISDIERGISFPSKEIMKKLSTDYKININWLLTGEGEMFKSPDQAPVKVETAETIRMQARIRALERELNECIVKLETEKKSNEVLDKEIADLKSELNDRLRALVSLQSEMLKMKPS
ncbi:MAG: helix-turn-helix domain-containing protein [Spirochaetes bacterium]|nr:helix-turn-helix domain-containing protein [Spirochaetota bacterium]